MGVFRLCPGYRSDDVSHTNPLSASPRKLCDICVEVVEIDAQINRLKNILADLEEKRAAVKSRTLNQLHDPFSRIPFEIASQIFVFYNDGPRGASNSSDLALRKHMDWSPQLLLASISKGWRQIALGTPELWTTIDVQIYSLSKIPLQVEVLNQYLSRSGARFLDILLYAVPTLALPEDSSIQVSHLLEAIRQCAVRWEKLSLNIPQCWYSTMVGDLSCAPGLVTLQLDQFSDEEGGDDPDGFHLPETPSLTILNLSGLLLRQVKVQLDYLTTFEGDAMSVDEIFEILRRAKRLLECTFTTLLDDLGDYPTPVAPIVHFSLRKLHFETSEECTDESLEAFFDGIQLPSLDYLHVDSSESAQVLSVFHCGFQSLFSRSQCALTRFSVYNDMFNGPGILSILENLPTVTELHLEGGRMITASVLKCLGEQTSLEDGTSPYRILPNRKRFSFKGRRKFSWRSLLVLFYPEWNWEVAGSIPPLKSNWAQGFSFYLCLEELHPDYIDKDVLPYFVHLHDEGILEIESSDRKNLIKASLEYHSIILFKTMETFSFFDALAQSSGSGFCHPDVFTEEIKT